MAGELHIDTSGKYVVKLPIIGCTCSRSVGATYRKPPSQRLSSYLPAERKTGNYYRGIVMTRKLVASSSSVY